MILCVGEILADMIGEEKNGSVFYERKAGGAPFNVACGAKKFGAETVFFGSVGNDLIGSFLVDFAKKQGLSAEYIATDGSRNTTLAFVQLDKNGERSFCFYRKNTADYNLADVPDELLERADTVHIGSLMLSEPAGIEYAKRLAVRARGAGKTVSFDVNFRSDIFRDAQTAVEAYKSVIALADVVKLSEEELEIFGEEYLRTLNGKLICISLGANGSEWRYNGRSGRVGTVKVKPVDTTGAGDAFYAGILSRLDGKPKGYTDELLNTAFKFGNVCGALTTQGRGAIDALPDLKTINKFI